MVKISYNTNWTINAKIVAAWIGFKWKVKSFSALELELLYKKVQHSHQTPELISRNTLKLDKSETVTSSPTN